VTNRGTISGTLEAEEGVHMEIQNAQVMKEARESLRGNWKWPIIVCIVYTILASLPNAIPDLGGVISFVISGPLALGLAYYSLGFSRGENPQWNILFDGFKRFVPSLLTYLYMTVLIVLWSFLLIVPGILKALSFSQTFFVLADDPMIGPRQAVKKSADLMKGYRWKYVCLNLRFFGWMLLCVLTLGIGFLWLYPYIQISYAKFYDEVKKRKSVDTPSGLQA